jgi:hypothetical protein
VSQADYVGWNSDFDSEIDAITQQMNASHSQNGTLDSFLRFSKLMLVDISAACQRAEVEQRVSVQNFLFRDGIAYDGTRKFLNTANVTLFQQLSALTHRKTGFGVPDGHYLNSAIRFRGFLMRFAKSQDTCLQQDASETPVNTARPAHPISGC